jgi:hypothetical protein
MSAGARAFAQVAATVALLLSSGPSHAYLADSSVHLPPNYLDGQPAARGEARPDPVFGTTVRRISDALSTPDAANPGTNVTTIITEYPTVTPFNSDNSRLLAMHRSYFALYDGSGGYIRDLLGVQSHSEPRWSRRDPNVLYYIQGNQLRRYDIASDLISVVRTFSEYTSISGRGESDIGFTGDRFVLVGDIRHVFVYDVGTDSKGPALDTTELGDFDNIFITPDDNVLIGWYARGTDRYQGIELYDRNMNFLRQVTSQLGHMDVARDVDGSEVVLWINAADPSPPDTCQNALVKIRLADGYRTCLATFDWALAHHVSAPDGNGWVFVSTYSPLDLSPLLQWPAYANEILQVRLDGSQVRRLAHHRSRPLNLYNFQPRAAVSRDGSRVAYSSNYGLQTLLTSPHEYSDVYVLAVGRRVEEEDYSNTAWVWRTCAWFPYKLPTLSGGRAMIAMDPGAYAGVRFTGTGIRWIGRRDAWSGIARVWLDYELTATVDTFASPDQRQAVLFSVDGLPPGEHYLQIEATGTRNANAHGDWVWADAFEVLSEAGIVRVEEEAASYWPCQWFTSSNSRHSGGTATLAVDPGTQLGFTFTGTGAIWIGYRDEWSGIANIYVDGKFHGEVDTYATPTRAQTVIYRVTGLPPGPHSLIIEASGRKNPASNAAWVWVDAFDLLP